MKAIFIYIYTLIYIKDGSKVGTNDLFLSTIDTKWQASIALKKF